MPRDLLTGLGLGALTVLVGLVLPEPLRAPLVGVLLGLAAGVYPGFALGGAAVPAERRLQWIVAVLFAGIAVVGVGSSPWWLAAGWTLHAGWDLRHHGRRAGAWVPGHYPMLCLSYDFVLVAFAGWLATRGGVT